MSVSQFLRLNRRYGTNNNNSVFGFPGKNKNKLQTIKDILNSDELTEDEIDYKSDDDEEISKENNAGPIFLNNPFNSSEISEDFVQNLIKLIKLKINMRVFLFSDQNGTSINNSCFGFPGKNKNKLQIIEDILNCDELTEDEIDFKFGDEDEIIRNGRKS
ncbi:CLUMA_CG018487, isoform A [Clunio marinus]|uniref:CLUMA_CG018487, isoform A n=1 Tax=Clunio marinus TaxID=568069 RepID=A0A1J1IZY8_9DIPT|nr:CLUMA_CG018487, isoform A [Clunio marinus]